MDGTGTERARVLALRAKNIKCLREVAISDLGDIVEIRGDTGQGKTAILTSIEAALRGIDPSIVRNGEGAAEIELNLSTMRVTRVQPAAEGAKETLMVTDRAGAPLKAGAAKDLLATLCSASAFRPIAWVRLGGGDGRGRTERKRDQRDQLLEALPMSLTEGEVAQAVKDLGREYARALGEVNLKDVAFDQHALVVCAALEKATYEFRKLQNAKAEAAENRLEMCPAPEVAAPDGDLATLEAARDEAITEYHAAKGRVDGRAETRAEYNRLKERVETDGAALPSKSALMDERCSVEHTVESAEVEVERLERALEAAREVRTVAQARLNEIDVAVRMVDAHLARVGDLKRLEEDLAGAPLSVNLEALETAKGVAERAVGLRERQDAHDEAAAAALVAREWAELFTGLVGLFRDTLPKRLIETAELPVSGLGVEGDTITIDGVPLHQLGTSEQIRVGVLIAAALNPWSGFILVDGAESMGSADRLALAEVARELGLQLIMTYVDESATPDPEHGRFVVKAGELVGAGKAHE